MLSIYSFGSGECDQLGKFILTKGLGEDVLERKTPKLIEFFKDPIKVFKIACGGMHTLVLSTKGLIYSFGNNDEGTLGREGTENVPGLVNLNVPMNGISCGDSHSIAYNTELNVIYQWGVYRDKNGSMCEKVKTPTEIPMSQFRRSKIKKVVSGENHTLVLAGGYVYAWGNPESGQIGRKVEKDYPAKALAIERLGAHPVNDIFAGKNHNFLLTETKRKVKHGTEKHTVLRAWGHNNYGQLGLGNTEQSIFTQSENEFFRDKAIKTICGGDGYTLVLLENGELYGMGRNDDGQLGFQNKEKDSEGNSIYTYPSPVRIEGAPKLTQMVTSSHFSYGIYKEENIAYSWGIGQNYVLGNKNEEDSKEFFHVPKEFFFNKIIGEIALGGNHVVVALHDTDKIENIVKPALEIGYLDEIRAHLEKGKEQKKGQKRKRIGLDDLGYSGKGTDKNPDDEKENEPNPQARKLRSRSRSKAKKSGK